LQKCYKRFCGVCKTIVKTIAKVLQVTTRGGSVCNGFCVCV
jgi:hypothetical protein